MLWVAMLSVVSLSIASVRPAHSDGPIAQASAPAPWYVELGALSVYGPTYEGAEDDETAAFPYFRVEYAERYFLDLVNGLGLYLLRDEHFDATASLAYDAGRDESDDDDVLDGLGTIDDGAALRLAGEYRLGPYSFGASLTDRVSSDDTGRQLGVAVAHTTVLANGWILKPVLLATVVDSDYADAYFGVNATQSEASGLTVYRPSGGLKSAGVRTDTVYPISSAWSLIGSLGFERLLDEMADSPIVVDRNQYVASLGVTYRLR